MTRLARPCPARRERRRGAVSGEEPVKAWTLPSSSTDDLSVLAEAVARALRRSAEGHRNRAYVHCRRWHRRWRSDIFVANGKPNLDCTRCGLRWVW